MSWLGYDAEQAVCQVLRVTLKEWSLNERRRVRVDLSVLYGSLSMFVNDMNNAVMSHDEVGDGVWRNAKLLAPDFGNTAWFEVRSASQVLSYTRRHR